MIQLRVSVGDEEFDLLGSAGAAVSRYGSCNIPAVCARNLRIDVSPRLPKRLKGLAL